MKIELIDDIRNAGKMISVQAFGALAGLANVQIFYNDIPEEIRSLIPIQYVPKIMLALAVVGFVGRMVKQFGVKDDNASN